MGRGLADPKRDCPFPMSQFPETAEGSARSSANPSAHHHPTSPQTLCLTPRPSGRDQASRSHRSSLEPVSTTHTDQSCVADSAPLRCFHAVTQLLTQQSHVRLCNPTDCPSPPPRACSNSVHRVGDAIQPSHPVSSPSPAFNPLQHQGFSQ